jgi:hypothetical protein
VVSNRILAQLIQEIRDTVDEPTSAYFNDRQIIRLINEGQRIVARDLYSITDIVTSSTIANQQEYLLPDDFIKESNLIFEFGETHRALEEVMLDRLLYPSPTSGTPEEYAIDLANRKFFLRPTPSANASTTTLNGAHSSTDTIITVTDTSAFPGSGRIKVDSEIIQYTAKTSTTFTGCIRGADGTIASTHNNGATVTQQNLFLYYSRLPKELKRIYVAGTVSVTNGIAIVTGVSTSWSSATCEAGNYFGIGSFTPTSASETFPIRWYKISSIDNLTQITLSGVYGESTAIGSNYIISDVTELYEAETTLLILFSLYRLSLKSKDMAKIQIAKAEFEKEMMKAIGRKISPDYLVVSGKYSHEKSKWLKLPADYPAI